MKYIISYLENKVFNYYLSINLTVVSYYYYARNIFLYVN